MAKLTFEELVLTLDYSLDALLITDGQANIIFLNESCHKHFSLPKEELLRANMGNLLERGIIRNSTVLKSIAQKKIVTEIVPLQNNSEHLSTSIPILDENNEVIFTVTNNRTSKVLDEYITAIEKISKKSKQYKNLSVYLSKFNNSDIVWRSHKMAHIFALAEDIAQTDSSVILYGESGTGKEVMANFIHSNSLRQDDPFVPVNCSAIPSELFESEFFGYSAGAFTGAHSKGKLGLFNMAHKGTLFLDEIGELPLSMQPKLLRVLETGKFRKIGSSVTEEVDIRVIASTNQDLRDMVDKKQFREDLYYRLNVMPMTMPPLRERKEDIVALADYFLDKLNAKYKTSSRFSSGSHMNLMQYAWPGNIRELKNAVESAYIVARGGDVKIYRNVNHMEDAQRNDEQPVERFMQSGNEKTLKDAVNEFEKKYTVRVIEQCGGSLDKASAILGVHRSTLFRKRGPSPRKTPPAE